MKLSELLNRKYQIRKEIIALKTQGADFAHLERDLESVEAEIKKMS